jgi:hypothetical protein
MFIERVSETLDGRVAGRSRSALAALAAENRSR